MLIIYDVIVSLFTALPRFVLSLRREVVRRGEMATLLCEAEGDRPMQIIWHHNGIQVSHESNERQVKLSFEIVVW
jgi:hypothetical protein